MNKNLALFDLDLTLINIDSHSTWCEFIVKKGLVDNKESYRQKNDYFQQEYKKGTLDAVESSEFIASFLTALPLNELYQLREECIRTEIAPFIRPLALQRIEKHRKQGDDILIISATNDFVVSGVAQLFSVARENVLATPLEVKNNHFTGKLTDKPNIRADKLYHLNKWLVKNGKQVSSYDKTYAYSDSHNDLPLLEWADIATCVSPDKKLTQIAIENNWQIENWAITI